jgi:non-ribosomal peptide synthetase component E (peptide arylation enzyme)
VHASRPSCAGASASSFGCVAQEVYGTAEGLINMTRLDDPEDLLLDSSGAPVCDADEIRVRRRRRSRCAGRRAR